MTITYCGCAHRESMYLSPARYVKPRARQSSSQNDPAAWLALETEVPKLVNKCTNKGRGHSLSLSEGPLLVFPVVCRCIFLQTVSSGKMR